MDYARRPIILIITINVVLIYLIFVLALHKNILSVTKIDYYNYLLDALLNGRVFLTPPYTYDLSLYKDHWYLYWGPAPIIFILPFYLISGIKTSDVFYTFIAGLGNIGLFYFVTKEFIRYFKLKVSFFSQLFVVLSFALCSPNFYLTISSGVWSTYQIVSIFYLLVGYVFYFKLLQNLESKRYLLLSVVFFCLAWMTRYSLFFQMIMFLFPVYIYSKEKKSALLRVCFTIGLVTALGFGLILSYNFLKFQNPFETGLKYQIGHPRSNAILRSGKLFSLEYVPHNVTHYFLNHVSLSLEGSPMKNFTLEGNSIFSVYPITLLLFFLFQRKYFKEKKQRMFLVLSALTVVTTFSFLLTFFASGWGQMGNRFFFDLVPLLYLITLFVVSEVPVSVLVLMLLYGILANFVGFCMFLLRNIDGTVNSY